MNLFISIKCTLILVGMLTSFPKVVLANGATEPPLCNNLKDAIDVSLPIKSTTYFIDLLEMISTSSTISIIVFLVLDIGMAPNDLTS